MRSIYWALGVAAGMGLAMGCNAAFSQCPISETGPMVEDNNGRRLMHLECEEFVLVTKTGATFHVKEKKGGGPVELYLVVAPLPDIEILEREDE